MNPSVNKSLSQALDLLLLFDADHPLYTVAEISRCLHFSQAKTYRLVRTLVRYGFLQADEQTARYTLGLNTLRLGLVAQQRFNLGAMARPFMVDLSRLTKETVLLTVVNGTRGIILEAVESEEPIRYAYFKAGTSLELHCGASNKILMAYLGEKEWDHIISREGLKRYTPQTYTRPEDLKGHLREIREKGYAFNDGEIYRDVRGVAAPVRNRLGEVVAGLGIAGPSYRVTKQKLKIFLKHVVQTSRKISAHLGHEIKKPAMNHGEGGDHADRES
jgi:DNA-binding IclR family transcriptional regulator